MDKSLRMHDSKLGLSKRSMYDCMNLYSLEVFEYLSNSSLRLGFTLLWDVRCLIRAFSLGGNARQVATLPGRPVNNRRMGCDTVLIHISILNC